MHQGQRHSLAQGVAFVTGLPLQAADRNLNSSPGNAYPISPLGHSVCFQPRDLVHHFGHGYSAPHQTLRCGLTHDGEVGGLSQPHFRCASCSTRTGSTYAADQTTTNLRHQPPNCTVPASTSTRNPHSTPASMIPSLSFSRSPSGLCSGILTFLVISSRLTAC